MSVETPMFAFHAKCNQPKRIAIRPGNLSIRKVRSIGQEILMSSALQAARCSTDAGQLFAGEHVDHAIGADATLHDNDPG